MTMVVTMANRDNIYFFADRRLTAAGTVHDEECGKTGVIFCDNGRFGFGFTGIARNLGLEVRRWLLNALMECAPPDYRMENLLSRFKNRATKDFRTLPQLARVPGVDRRFSVIFSGFLTTFNPPKLALAIVSNFQDYETNTRSLIAWPEFRMAHTTEKSPLSPTMTSIQRVGTTAAFPQEYADEIRPLLERRPSPKAIVRRTTDLMLRVARSPYSAGTVGKQLNWFRIPSRRDEGVEVGYYSNVVSHTDYVPSAVWALSRHLAVLDDVRIEALDPATTPPIVVPRTRPNRPCPCGSRTPYKRCHGAGTRMAPPFSIDLIDTKAPAEPRER
jgi:hypothetical protein